jgi:hypothetical protein
MDIFFCPLYFSWRQLSDAFFNIFLSLKTTYWWFPFYLLKFEDITWVSFFFLFTQVWRQHMDVFSFYLVKSEDNTCMFFLHFIKPEDNTWMFVFHLLKPEDNTWMVFFHFLKPEDNTWMFFLFIYISLKIT